jgi:hypothetical protein
VLSLSVADSRFRRKAFTKPAGKKEVEASAVYGIASVFTADKHRSEHKL